MIIYEPIEIIHKDGALLSSKIIQKGECMTRSQVPGWNPLEGFTKSNCGKLRLGSTLPASNSKKG